MSGIIKQLISGYKKFALNLTYNMRPKTSYSHAVNREIFSS